MSNQLALVILAGGLGSRYNGQKQIDGMGPNNECLMEYSIFDALQAGISHFVFVINSNFTEQSKEYFKQIIEGNGAKVDFVIQTPQLNVPIKYINSNFDRQKPWGTAHALLTAKDVVKSSFIVINADDYYGKKAFHIANTWIKNNVISENQYGIVAYELQKTLSENGSVSRGICIINHDLLYDVEEQTTIYKEKNSILSVHNDKKVILNPETPVSMNFWVLHPSVFKYLKKKFHDFLFENSTALKTEFYLPQALNELIQTQKVAIQACISKDKWFGVTYPDDKIMVQNELLVKIESNEYPKKLWM